MNPNKADHINLEKFIGGLNKDSIFNFNTVNNIIDFGNGKELISYSPKTNNTVLENSQIINLKMKMIIQTLIYL